MTATFSQWAGVVLRALAQLVFADSATSGLLVLAAMLCISPWCAAGALAGALVGVAAGYALPYRSYTAWRAGLSGFNTAIIGILWGGFIASGDWQIPLFLILMACCIVFERVTARCLDLVELPVLSAPAVLTATAASMVLAPSGTWFWVTAPPSPLGTLGVLCGMLCVAAAMALKSVRATAQAVILSTIVAVLAVGLGETDALAVSDLWAFTVALATFSVHAVFVGPSKIGSVAGLAAGALGAGLWIAWMLTGLQNVVPPLLTPYILAVWMTLLLVRRVSGSVWLNPAFWRLLGALSGARRDGRGIVALLGNDVRGPDQLGNPALPIRVYSRERFLSSPRCRRLQWESIEQLRTANRLADPGAAHRALASLDRQGWLTMTVTAHADGLLRRADARHILELNGCLGDVRCLDCDAEQPWPPAGVWRRYELRCPACAGLLRPSMPHLDDGVANARRQAAERLVASAGVLLVLGTARGCPHLTALLDRARTSGTRVSFLSAATAVNDVRAGDILIPGSLDRTVHALSLAYGGWGPRGRPVGRADTVNNASA